MNAKPRILIVDDNEGFRHSVAFMLGKSSYQIEQYGSAESVLESLDGLSLDEEVCMLLDVRMPGLSGLDLHDHLNSKQTSLPVIYMTGHADVPLAVEAMKKGAVTLLEKPLDPATLKQAVDVAIESARKKPRDSVQNLSPEELAEIEKFEQLLSSVTPRENEVLECMVQGMANKYCAFELDISVRTVELHRARLLKKLQVRSGAELIRAVLLHRARVGA